MMNQPENLNISGDGYLFVVPWRLELAGGVNEVVISLYRHFSHNKLYRPMVLIPTWGHQTEHYCIVSGRETLYLRLQEFPRICFASLKEMIVFILRWPFTLKRLYSLICKYGIRIVNPHYPGLFLIHFAALKILFPDKFKLVVSFHGSDVIAMERSLYFASIMKWILLRADAITVSSDALFHRLALVTPKVTDRIKCIYNGVDHSKFMQEYLPSPLLPHRLKDKSYVLHVGSFEPVKGQDILLRAFKKLYELHPSIHLLLVGRSGSFLSTVKKDIVDLGLSGQVFVITDVKHDDIPALMKGSAFIVLPSRSEGFPLVLLEAAISNRAVIASSVGGIPELIKNGENGLLVEPDNQDQLTSAMVKLVEDCSLRNNLAEELSSFVSANYSWERTANSFAEITINT